MLAIPLALPPRLLLLGGGPDVQPLVDIAARMAWRITVYDHRPAYAEASRFPQAEQVLLGRPETLPETVDLNRYDAAVVMSHHLPSDLGYLRGLSASRIPYVGLLGPARRREKLLADLGAMRRGWRAAALADRHQHRRSRPNRCPVHRRRDPCALDRGARRAVLSARRAMNETGFCASSWHSSGRTCGNPAGRASGQRCGAARPVADYLDWAGGDWSGSCGPGRHCRPQPRPVLTCAQLARLSAPPRPSRRGNAACRMAERLLALLAAWSEPLETLAGSTLRITHWRRAAS